MAVVQYDVACNSVVVAGILQIDAIIVVCDGVDCYIVTVGLIERYAIPFVRVDVVACDGGMA